jgi:hypothetical protein
VVFLRIGAPLLAAVGIATALSACGSSPPKASISKAEFIRRADAICFTGAKRVSAIPSPNVHYDAATRQQLPQIAHYLPHIIEELQSEHNGIAALPNPTGGKALITQSLAYLQQYIQLLTYEQKAAAAGNLAGFETLFAQETQADSPVLAANRLARQFGLKICGQG